MNKARVVSDSKVEVLESEQETESLDESSKSQVVESELETESSSTPEKVITVRCTKGLWSSEFWTKDDETYVTIPDFRLIQRAMKAGHRLYIRGLNLKLRLKKRLAEEEKANTMSVTPSEVEVESVEA